MNLNLMIINFKLNFNASKIKLSFTHVQRAISDSIDVPFVVHNLYNVHINTYLTNASVNSGQNVFFSFCCYVWLKTSQNRQVQLALI